MTGWTAIVPVKAWSSAKSRLDVSPALRHDLARAFTLDVLDALSDSDEVRQVVLVSAQAELRTEASARGMHLLDDESTGSDDPLNDAIRTGLAWARSRRPGSPVVVVPADLAAVTGEVVTQTLLRARSLPHGFVPDSGGDGTTMLMAQRPDDLLPSYGPMSAHRHARAVPDADPRVRQDVDTVDDLRDAWAVGVGSHTRAAVLRARRELPGIPVETLSRTAS